MANLQSSRKSSSLGPDCRGFLISLACLFCATGFAATQGDNIPSRPVRIECLIDEASPIGTVVEVLLEKNPKLRNFRITSGNRSEGFSVDSSSGAITVQKPEVLEFGRQPVHRLTIKAEPDTPERDSFQDEFAASLLEEGISFGSLHRAESVEARFVVTIRLRELPKQTDQSEELTPEIAAVPIEPATPAIPPVSIAETGVKESASPVDFAGETADVPPMALDPEPVEPVAVAEDPDNTVREIAKSFEPLLEELPNALVSVQPEAPSVAADPETAPLATPETQTSLDTSSPRDHSAAIILFVAVVISSGFLAVIFGRARRARREALRVRQEDKPARVLANAIAPVPLKKQPEIAIAAPAAVQDGRKVSDRLDAVKAARPTFDEAAESRSTRDPESLIPGKFLNNPDQRTTDAETDPVRRLRARINDRDAMIADLTQKLADYGQKTGDDPYQQEEIPESIPAASGPNEPGHINVPAFDWTPRPAADIRNRKNHSHVDPKARPSHASDSLERTLERLNESPVGVQAEPRQKASDPAVATLDRPDELRSELQELFAVHSKTASSETKLTVETLPETINKVINSEAPHSEEDHQDSIAKYLSNLLDRKKEDGSTDSLFDERRKSGGKFNGGDRRTERDVAPQRKPVKSYLETYMNEQGGLLADDPLGNAMPAPQGTLKSMAPPASVEPLAERIPVDVTSIRAHMTSFREVAIKSVEQALATHSLRQAHGGLAFRKALLVALLLITVFVVTANMLHAMQLNSLNWLMGAVVVLSFAELCLRAQSMRSHRLDLLSRTMTLESDEEAPDNYSEFSNDRAPFAG